MNPINQYTQIHDSHFKKYYGLQINPALANTPTHISPLHQSYFTSSPKTITDFNFSIKMLEGWARDQQWKKMKHFFHPIYLLSIIQSCPLLHAFAHRIDNTLKRSCKGRLPAMAAISTIALWLPGKVMPNQKAMGESGVHIDFH